MDWWIVPVAYAATLLLAALFDYLVGIAIDERAGHNLCSDCGEVWVPDGHTHCMFCDAEH